MKGTKLTALLLVLVMLATLLGGCASGDADSTSQSSASAVGEASGSEESAFPSSSSASQTASGEREITDMAGRVMTVPATIDKVFSADSVAAIYLYTFDPELLIGWNYELNDTEKKIVLPEYHDLPSYGMGDSINYEAVIAAVPQIAFTVGNLGEASIESADQLSESLGVPVFMVSNDFLETADVYRAMGELFGDEGRGEALAQYVDEVFAEVEAAAVPEEEQVTVYFGNGTDSLETAPRGSSHAQIFEVVGAINVADVESESGSRVQVSLEQILAWNPEYMIVNGEPKENLTGNSAAEEILQNPDFATVQAVEAGHVYGSPKAPFSWVDRPPGPNRVIGVRWLSKLFYPDRYDYEIEDEVKEFYNLFYHIDLSDEAFSDLFTD